ncbi:MAG TPA: ATP-binding protein [Roseimicrobium sp.]|nr:ATP-binding protein [Roseimicrobium sp.]
MGLVLRTNLQQRQLGVTQVKETARQIANLAAARQEGTVRSVHQLLSTLSELPLFQGKDQRTYGLHFANLLKLHPEYTDYGLIETNGALFASAVPGVTPTDMSVEPCFRQALISHAVSSGTLNSDKGNRTSLYFTCPVLTPDGVVVRVMYAALNMAQLDQNIDQAGLPAGASLSVLDRGGNVLTRFPKPKEADAKPPGQEEAMSDMPLKGQEVFESVDARGSKILYAVLPIDRSRLSGLFVCVGIPRDIAFAGANQLLVQNLLLLAFVTVAVFVLARIYAEKTILTPLNALMQTAGRITSGDLEARTGLAKGASELGRFVQAFDRMAETLQKRQVEITQAEGKFRILVEQSIVGIYIIQENRLVYVNPRLAEIVGRPWEEVTGKDVLLIIAPEDRRKVSENIQKRLEGVVTSLHYQLHLLHADGSAVAVEAHGSATSFGGKPAIIGTLMDISERLEAEEEVRRLNRDLEQRVVQRTAQLAAANQELEAFSYSVSHDLRAPLRHVDGFADLLRKHTSSSLDEKGRRLLDTISESAKRMGVLIDDLLSFSRMGRAEFRQSEVDLGLLVKDVLRSMEHDIKDRKVDWQIHPLPVVIGDVAMLRQVFVNLVSNALKYSRTREMARVEVGVMSGDEGETIIYVRDNGVGFDMKYAGKLFGVFQRLHGTNQFEGTGIGLANVRRIIQRHAGRTWAEGQEGEGATFYISFPAVMTQKTYADIETHSPG